jgi:hypothetical protein
LKKSKLINIIVIGFLNNSISALSFWILSIFLFFFILFFFLSWVTSSGCVIFFGFFVEFCFRIDNWYCYIDWSQCFTWELDNSWIFILILSFIIEIASILTCTVYIRVCSIDQSRLISAENLRTRRNQNFNTVIASCWQNWVLDRD